MMEIPSPQLSFDFEFVSDEPVSGIVSACYSLDTSATKYISEPVSGVSNATIVSLCGFRERREQQKISLIYKNILASISHIA